MNSPIPAGSLASLDFNRIRRDHPEIADDLLCLGQLMDRGFDSDAEFVKLCRLLLIVGERQKAKDLLLANCEYGDEAHAMFLAEFPDANAKFESSVSGFSSQYGCGLTFVRAARCLSKVFSCRSTSELRTGVVREIIADANGSEIHITYQPDCSIVADLYSLGDSDKEAAMRYDGLKWFAGNTRGQREESDCS